MRILHSAFFLYPGSGILNQMDWEAAAARDMGLDWVTKLFCFSASREVDHELVVANEVQKSAQRWPFFRKIALRKKYYAWLTKECAGYDALILRYSISDPFLLSFIKSVDLPVFTVHHTKEGDEAKSIPYWGWLRSGIDDYLLPRIVGKATGVIAVTDEILKYELNRADAGKQLARAVFPNGIKYSGDEPIDTRDDVPNIVFVASYFSNWHGLDRVINSILNSEENFVCHIVGEVSDADRRMAIKDHRICLHGSLSAAEIRILCQKSWVGLSSFALYRKGMKEACTLKVREYLESGLPVYSGHRDVFPESFPFFNVGDPDICKILDFAREVRKFSKKEISLSAKPFIEKKLIMQSMYSFIEEASRA